MIHDKYPIIKSNNNRFFRIFVKKNDNYERNNYQFSKKCCRG